MLTVFPVALERGEVVLNGIEVRRIRRQEQQCGSRRVQELLGAGAFVERGIVHDHHVIAMQLGTQFLGEPGVEERGRTAARKQKWGL